MCETKDVSEGFLLVQAQESENNLVDFKGDSETVSSLENNVFISKMQIRVMYNTGYSQWIPIGYYLWRMLVFKWQGWAASACTGFDMHDTDGHVLIKSFFNSCYIFCTSLPTVLSN